MSGPPGRKPRKPRAGPEGRRPRRPRTIGFLYEDEDLVAVDKPAGMLSVGEGRQPTALGLVKDRVQRGGRRRRVWVVHRLDREVSGVMVFAVSERGLRWLKEDFAAGRVGGAWLALVEGAPTTPTTATARGGRRTLGSGGGHALLEIEFEPEPKRQLRAQLAAEGTPVAGDRRHEARTDPLHRLALHAWLLELNHPSGRTLTFESPAPPAMFKAIGLAPDAAQASPAATAAARSPAARDRGASDARASGARASGERGWDHVANWYDKLRQEGHSDHFQDLVEPGALRLLGVGRGARVLDVACGEGALGRRLAGLGATVVGVDASERLVEAARSRAGPGEEYRVGDARALESLDLGHFDAVCSIMALMNIDPLAPLMRGVAALLRPGGVFVAVILHPAFRAPRQTSWGWDADATPPRQYRRVEGYLSSGQSPIIMNPGAAARGVRPITTTTYHRPIQAYIEALREAGMVVESIEEWPSLRRSEPGPRAEAENRARREIPLLLAWRARRIDLPPDRGPDVPPAPDGPGEAS